MFYMCVLNNIELKTIKFVLSVSVWKTSRLISCHYPLNNIAQKQFTLDIINILEMFWSMWEKLIGYMQILCHLCKGLEYLWILVSAVYVKSIPHNWWRWHCTSNFVKNVDLMLNILSRKKCSNSNSYIVFIDATSVISQYS